MHTATITDDLWDIGWGAGAFGWDWVRTVGGRSLTAGQRRELYRGWQAGREERAGAGHEIAAGRSDDVDL